MVREANTDVPVLVLEALQEPCKSGITDLERAAEISHCTLYVGAGIAGPVMGKPGTDEPSVMSLSEHNFRVQVQRGQ
jgi:hypothetical protein